MPKVFELLIDEDDDLSGVQYISIVKAPANEVKFEVFSEDKPHSCYVEHDFSSEAVEVIEKFGVELNPDALIGARIKPAVIELTSHDFAPAINPNPRQFDILSGDQEDGNVITRYIYGIDTGMGAPLIRTSREWCRKMIASQRVFSRQDLVNLSNSLTADGDTFKLIPRARMNPQVNFFEYKGGALCRHRWFQIEFPVKEGETYQQALARLPLKAQTALGVGNNVGGAGRPFQAEAKIVPPSQLNRRPAAAFSSVNEYDAINFHMGLFMYKTRKAALAAEPSAKTITKVKIKACDWGWGCEGYVPIEVLPEYFEGTAEVVNTFKVRETFAKLPDYIRDVAKRAVDYAEENGWGDCGTDVGKRRANDLADPNYTPSMDIITRMYSYGSRHKKDWESSDGFDDGCGDLMMAAWGFSRSNFDQAMNWLEGQMDKATQDMVAFSQDEYKGDITAVVFQPDQKIYRYDRETQQPYYVFMSKDTIRKMLLKVSRLKPKHFINFEHTDKIFSGDDVFSYENWLVGEDPKKDKSYEIFGREFPEGTWITTIHFRNRELFDNFILSNQTAGVSLEGLFEEVPFNFMKVKENFVYPTAGEGKDEFVSRCVGSSQMVSEFPDQEQRLAVCYSYWEQGFSVDTAGMVNYLDPNDDELLKKKVDMEFPEGTCWEGYEPYGTKILNNREVPNCVPIKTSKIQMEMEMDVFGYKTEYFFVCPMAQELFKHLVSMETDEDEQGMIRSLALQADAVFRIEYEAMKRGSATIQELEQAVLLVDDFKDLMYEVDELLGMSHDVSFMDGHINTIASLTEDFAPYPWDECIKDMTERYGASSAPKICGKIRSENMNRVQMSKEDFDAAIRVFLLEDLLRKVDK